MRMMLEEVDGRDYSYEIILTHLFTKYPETLIFGEDSRSYW